ncbi:MAG: thioredoxin [Clostridiales bacterium]|nr:thioredoxin [Clostridiales bacterium]
MKKVTTAEFKDEVLDNQTPVLVDFFADWCGPCRSQAPLLEQLAGEMDGEIKIVKVNVDDEPELARRYGVMSIPTLVLFKTGEPAKKAVGLHAMADLKTLIS